MVSYLVLCCSVASAGGRGSLARIVACWAILAIALLAGGPPAAAQSNDPMFTLASRSAIVVLATVTKVGESEEPLQAPSSATAIIKIKQMLAGSEFAGDQTGHTATIILNKPGDVKVGTQAIFFGNPRFIGKTITIADVDELPSSWTGLGEIPQVLAQGLQARHDAPIRARLAIAEKVFRGTVESVRPLAGADRELRDEHDPDWQLATVRVVSAFSGTKEGDVVPVVFPASRDIVWFNSPKLHTGDQVLVLAHQPQEDELRLLRTSDILSIVKEQRALVVSQPYDVLTVQDEKRLVGLLQTKEGP